MIDNSTKVTYYQCLKCGAEMKGYDVVKEEGNRN